MTPRKTKKAPAKAKKSDKVEKPIKRVFMIMPFRKTPSRNQSQLTSFYEDQVKRPIEKARLANRYEVRRSDNTFNITAKIVQDLYYADIVICDLSGLEANPNVMYELGMRLAFSHSPVILIREKHADNRAIFDITGFYAEPYDPLSYTGITKHLIEKLRGFETGSEEYQSPVLAVLEQDLPLLKRLSRRQADRKLMHFAMLLDGTLRIFGSAIQSFLSERSATPLGGGTSSMSNDLVNNMPEYRKLDWESFSFRVGTQPAVDAYLQEPYLVDLVDAEVERAFAEALMDYHSLFLAGDHMQNPWNIATVYIFVATSLLLRTLGSDIADILSHEKWSSQEGIEQFMKDHALYQSVLPRDETWSATALTPEADLKARE